MAVDLTLTVKTLNLTSLDTVTYQVGGVQATTPGASATTPVALVLTGLSEGTNSLFSSFGTLQFTVDAAGNVASVDPAKMTASGSTLTIQNTISFPTLLIDGVNATSLNDVSFWLREADFSNFVGPVVTRTISGVDFPGTGVTYAFEGMLVDQVFAIDSSFGKIRFVLDAAGNMVPQRVEDQGKFIASGSTMTLQNTLDHNLKITAAQNSTTPTITHDLLELNFSNLVDSQSLAGSGLAAGVDMPMLGMLADQGFLLSSDVGRVIFDLRADGTAVFRDPAVQLTPTKGSLEIENGTNTLFLELVLPNEAPVVSIDSGTNLTILSEDQPFTVLLGNASDGDGDELTCRWLEGTTVLFGPVVITGACDLDLGTLAPLAVGDHTLTLEVTDGIATVTDTIVVTVDNSQPVAAPIGGGVFQIGPSSEVILGGDVSDFDGDTLTFEWRLGGAVVFSGQVVAPFGGDPVMLPEQAIGTQALGLGIHQVDLAVSDGINDEVVESVTVEIIDTEAPTLDPVPSTTILWPPNHKLVAVAIQANAADNLGGAVTLSVEVASSEPPEFDGDGNFEPDIEIVTVDSATGLIDLNLRSERSGKGDGRVYTVTITATDGVGNQSSATVLIKAPHNK